jgi:uncharacterized protein YecE (DUF72 family)
MNEEFSSRLDAFFGQLPKDFRYAVEIRNAGLLGPEYRQVLKNHEVAHVYNHWSYMPSLAEQHQRMEERFTAPFTVLRLLTPLEMSYEAAKNDRSRTPRLWKNFQACDGHLGIGEASGGRESKDVRPR